MFECLGLIGFNMILETALFSCWTNQKKRWQNQTNTQVVRPYPWYESNEKKIKKKKINK